MAACGAFSQLLQLRRVWEMVKGERDGRRIEDDKRVSPSAHALENGKLYMARPTGTTITVETIDILTSLSEGTFVLPLPAPSTTSFEMCVCGTKLLVYITNAAFSAFVYDIPTRDIFILSAGSSSSGRVYKSLQGQRVVSACAGHARDGDTFFVAVESGIVHCLLVRPSGVTLSPPCRVDTSPIISLTRHPIEPVILVATKSSDKGIKVFNYMNLRKAIRKEAGLDCDNLNDSSAQTTIYGERDWEGEGGDSTTSPGDDTQTDVGEGKTRTRQSLSISSLSLSSAVRGRSNTASTPALPASGSTEALVQCSVLSPPAPAMVSYLVTMSPSTGLCAVLWKFAGGGTTVCIYDVRQLALRPDGGGGYAVLTLQALVAAPFPSCTLSISLHPSEPVLLALSETDLLPSMRNLVISAHSLQDAALRIVGSHNLGVAPRSVYSSHHSVVCCSLTGSVVFGSCTSKHLTPTLSVYSLSAQWCRLHSFTSLSVISSLPTSPHYFLEGDGSSAPLPPPLCLGLRSSVKLLSPSIANTPTSLGSPVSVRHDLHRLILTPLLLGQSNSIDSKEKESRAEKGRPSEFLGSLMDESAKVASCWNPVPASDLLSPQSFLFAPASIKHSHDSAAAAASSGSHVPTIALITGTIWGGGDAATLLPRPAVYFVRISNGQQSAFESALCSYRDAAWLGAGVLVISADGYTLKLFMQPSSSTSEQTLRQWHVPNHSLAALWPSEDTLPATTVLYLVRDGDREALLLSAPGRPDLVDARAELRLQPGECMLEASWQPLPPLQSAAAQAFRPTQGGAALLGVLTSQRVMLITTGTSLHSLCVLSSLCHSPQIAVATTAARSTTHGDFLRGLGVAGAHAKIDGVTSLSWLGAALVFVRESGAIGYLLPGPTQTMSPSQSRCSVQRRKDLGLSPNNSPADLSGVLCFLPRGLSQRCDASPTTLVCCLPDRILFASSKSEEGLFGSISLFCRPILPVEPLVLSILALLIQTSKSQPQSRHQQATSTALEAATILLLLYLPARFLPGASRESGAQPCGQASRRLCVALNEAGQDFALLAAVAAGVSPAAASQSTELGNSRWLPPLLKFQLAVAADRPVEASLELLAEQPDLVEPFLDPASYVDLPHPQSKVAGLIALAASSMRSIPSDASSKWMQQACRLADLAGNEELLCELLTGVDASDGGDGGDEALRTLLAAIKVTGANLLLQNRIVARLRVGGCGSGEEKGTLDPAAAVEVLHPARVVGARIRSSMLPLASQSSADTKSKSVFRSGKASVKDKDKDERKGKGKEQEFPLAMGVDELAALELRQRSLQKMRLGPALSLGPLSLDRLEDTVGCRLQLEGLSQHRSGQVDLLSRFGVSEGVGVGGAGAGAGAAKSGTGSALPVGWIEGLGEGKDWDKVCGYWRLSDVARAGEEGFGSCVAGSLRGARLCVLDLSKYAGAPLELFAASQSQIHLEPSVSPLDPGDDHEKVKSLFDLTYADGGRDCGVRARIERGGPLDIGVGHDGMTDPLRCRLTIELTLGLVEAPTVAPLCLARRASISRKHEEVMWSLLLHPDASLQWVFGPPGGAEAGLRSPPGSAPLPVRRERRGDKSDEPFEMQWLQVAAVIDSSRGPAEVTLFVNGQLVANAPPSGLAVPLFSEALLSSSCLLWGLDLPRGSRLTELRVWCDARGGLELEAQREGFLALASKRKRLQFRIRGGKKLFAALRLQAAFALHAPSDAIVVPRPPDDDKKEAPTPMGMKGAFISEPQSKSLLKMPGGKGGAASLLTEPPTHSREGLLQMPGKGCILQPPTAPAKAGLLQLPAPAGGGLLRPPARGQVKATSAAAVTVKEPEVEWAATESLFDLPVEPEPALEVEEQAPPPPSLHAPSLPFPSESLLSPPLPSLPAPSDDVVQEVARSSSQTLLISTVDVNEVEETPALDVIPEPVSPFENPPVLAVVIAEEKEEEEEQLPTESPTVVQAAPDVQTADDLVQPSPATDFSGSASVSLSQIVEQPSKGKADDRKAVAEAEAEAESEAATAKCEAPTTTQSSLSEPTSPDQSSQGETSSTGEASERRPSFIPPHLDINNFFVDADTSDEDEDEDEEKEGQAVVEGRSEESFPTIIPASIPEAPALSPKATVMSGLSRLRQRLMTRKSDTSSISVVGEVKPPAAVLPTTEIPDADAREHEDVPEIEPVAVACVKIKVLEALQCELGPNLVVRSYSLGGKILGKTEGMGQREAEAGLELHLRLCNDNPGQLGSSLCNDKSFNAIVAASAVESGGNAEWALSPRDGSFVSGEPQDVLLYKFLPTFRPMVLRARCTVDSQRDGPRARALLRVAIELNPVFAPRIGSLETRLLLRPLCLLSQLVDYEIEELTCSRAHVLSPETMTLAWTVGSADVPVPTKLVLEAKMRLRLKGAADDAPAPDVAFPSSLPVRISTVMPNSLLSATTVAVDVRNRPPAFVAYSSKADMLIAAHE